MPKSSLRVLILYGLKSSITCCLHVISNSTHVMMSSASGRVRRDRGLLLNIAEWSTPAAANVSALRLHCVLKVARSEPSVDCGWPSYNSYFLRIKGCMLLLEGQHHSLSFYDPILSSHTQTHTQNDLLSSLCSRLPLRSGRSCPSSGWQCFYYPSYVVFIDGHEQLLVDSDSVHHDGHELLLVDSDSVQHDGIDHPSVHLASVRKLISVRKRQRLPVQQPDSFGVSAHEQEWHFLLLLRLLYQHQQLLLLLEHSILLEHSLLIPTSLHLRLCLLASQRDQLSTQGIQNLPTPVQSQQRSRASQDIASHILNPSYDLRHDLR